MPKNILITFASLLLTYSIAAQSADEKVSITKDKTIARVIIDND
jgi:hypothetical protein